MSEADNKHSPLVARAADVIVATMMGVPEKDRPHVLEAVNKTGLLSAGKSKLEKDQEKEHADAVKASEAWVAQVKKDQEVALSKRGEPVKAEESKKEGKK
jgi:cytochrome P450